MCNLRVVVLPAHATLRWKSRAHFYRCRFYFPVAMLRASSLVFSISPLWKTEWGDRQGTQSADMMNTEYCKCIPIHLLLYMCVKDLLLGNSVNTLPISERLKTLIFFFFSLVWVFDFITFLSYIIFLWKRLTHHASLQKKTGISSC